MIYAIILASGIGERLGLGIPKQFFKIKNKTILEYSISAFDSHQLIDKIIVVSNPLYINETKDITKNYKKVISVISGGKTRQESSFRGLSQITDTNSKVLIHDAVRPFVSNKIITDCIIALNTYKAVNVGIKSTDTIMEITDKNVVSKIIDRSKIIRCQTPQAFDFNIINKAHQLAINDSNKTATDDCGLVLRYNLADIFVVNGENSNIKITYPIDLKIAELLTSEK